MPGAGRDAIELMEWLMQFNPKKRPLANDILKHAYFLNGLGSSEIQKAFDILSGKRPMTTNNRKGEMETLKVGAEGI